MRKKAAKKLTPAAWLARFNAAKAATQREYCNIFRFWRNCPFRPCRKIRACSGDQNACLQRGEKHIPREIQWEARQRVLAATRAHVSSPEHMAREFLPSGFYE